MPCRPARRIRVFNTHRSLGRCSDARGSCLIAGSRDGLEVLVEQIAVHVERHRRRRVPDHPLRRTPALGRSAAPTSRRAPAARSGRTGSRRRPARLPHARVNRRARLRGSRDRDATGVIRLRHTEDDATADATTATRRRSKSTPRTCSITANPRRPVTCARRFDPWDTRGAVV